MPFRFVEGILKVGGSAPQASAAPCCGLIPAAVLHLVDPDDVGHGVGIGIIIVHIKPDEIHVRKHAEIFKGGGKLVGILQPVNIGVVPGVVGCHHINQGVCGKDVDNSVQPAEKTFQRHTGVVERVLRSGEGLLLHHVFDTHIGVEGKHPKGKDNQQKINTHQLVAKPSAVGGPQQPPPKLIPHRHASAGTLWATARFHG